MPVNRRKTQPASSVQHAKDAAISTPIRKKRPQQSSIEAFLTTFDSAPLHLKDNRFILRGYRAGHDFKAAIKSALRIHNETGNIWTHLIGFLIFFSLTFTTIQLRPEPLRLGAEALLKVEHRLGELGSTSLYEFLNTAEAWERTVLRLGAEGLVAVEEALRSIGSHNLGEIATLRDAMAESVGSSARGVGRRLREYKETGIAELAYAEERLTNFSAVAVRDLEAGINRALASVLGTSWPVSRWPMHVFTAGAMICLLTSAVCHLFGCCAAHVSAIMWRFDYAGIAVLIVASFYPPVYYGFMCQPTLSFLYLLTTTLLGISTLSVTLMERFQAPNWHQYRAALFVALGMWGIVPLIHGCHLHGGESAFVGAVQLDLVMGAIYILGAVVYAARVPERWKPGAFDVAFHSHQLFHVAVVVAAMIHYKASRQLMHWRDATGGCLAI